jgi:hypothetical protein
MATSVFGLFSSFLFIPKVYRKKFETDLGQKGPNADQKGYFIC